MKLSVRAKLIMLLFGTVVVFVVATILINTLMLRPYYKRKKEQALTNSFSTICGLDFASPDISTKLKSIEENSNVQILIIDYKHRVFFCSSAANDSLFLPVTDGENGIQSGEQWFSDWLIPKEPGKPNDYDSVEIFSTQPRFSTPYNSVLSASYISLYAKSLIDYNGAKLPFYFIINTRLAAVVESLEIFNSFTAFVGLAILIFGGFATVLLSNRIVEPIVRIKDTAQRISELKFDQKISITSNDEIGELAASVNNLSDQLETKINELSVTNSQLRDELDHRERVDIMRRNFISDVSHELKTPLAIILGYCEGLQLNVNSDEREYYCSIIEDEALRMSRLASRLLLLAELESDEKQYEMADFDLAALAQARLQKLSYLLEERSISWTFESEGSTMAYGDADRIEEVVNNLLTNAKNYTPDSGNIKVKVSETENRVRCEVYNSGSHIPENSLDQIWLSFYKVDKARSRQYGGSGLGLKIVSTIIQSHDGCFGAENTEDGVRFYFELKKAQGNAAHDDKPEEDEFNE